jgi:hypothetical protein
MPTTSSYPAARGCEARLNAWCDANCPHSREHGSLFARLDASDRGPNAAWRCYARQSLSEDLLRYAEGSTYCTRHAQLSEELDACLRENLPAESVVVDPDGRVQPQRRQAAAPAAVAEPPPGVTRPALRSLKASPPPQAVEEWISAPRHRVAPSDGDAPPHYQHISSLMRLPDGLRVPRLDDCDRELVAGAEFWATSLYTSSYAHKAARLDASCSLWGVCCSAALVPDGAFDGGSLFEGSLHLRHRLIATKPLFILNALRLSPIPLVWLDVDLEFHSFPTLFTPAGWLSPPHGPGPRDVLLWNWQGNVSHFRGRRLKTASGVAWFNKTTAAEELVEAWAEAMAYEPNMAAPDDQTLDLLVNDDGWIDRAAFGWLPASYLRMMPRHKHVVAVIDHDRGNAVSGIGRNSPVKPVLPPRAIRGGAGAV